ncbi:separin protein [Dimargaris verticillata]|uniref:separase n=1 Tax=Dimargaris verticillata TaxID=2761393 RepID=A0A9W8B5K5_9FUNG|nr:separin protein [Dimargaris verticillata]
MALPPIPTTLTAITADYHTQLVSLLAVSAGPAKRTTKVPLPTKSSKAKPAASAARGPYALKVANALLAQLSANRKPQANATLAPQTAKSSAVVNHHALDTIDACLGYLWATESTLKLKPLDLAKLDSNYSTKLIQLGCYERAMARLAALRQRLLATTHPQLTTRPGKSSTLRGKNRPGIAATTAITASHRGRTVRVQPTTTRVTAKTNENQAPSAELTKNKDLVPFVPIKLFQTDATFNLLCITVMTNALRCIAELGGKDRARQWVPYLVRNDGTCYDWCRELRFHDASTAALQMDVYFRVLHRLAALFAAHEEDFVVLKGQALRAFAHCQSFTIAQYVDLALHTAMTVERAFKSQTVQASDAAERLYRFYQLVWAEGAAMPKIADAGSWPKVVEHYLGVALQVSICHIFDIEALYSSVFSRQIVITSDENNNNLAPIRFDLLPSERCNFALTIGHLLANNCDVFPSIWDSVIKSIQYHHASLDNHLATTNKLFPDQSPALLPLLNRMTALSKRAFSAFLAPASSFHNKPARPGKSLTRGQREQLAATIGPYGQGIATLVRALNHLNQSPEQTKSPNLSKALLGVVELGTLCGRLLFDPAQPRSFTLVKPLLDHLVCVCAQCALPDGLHLVSSVCYNFGGSLYQRQSYYLAAAAFSFSLQALQQLIGTNSASPRATLHEADGEVLYRQGAFCVKREQLFKRCELLGACQYADNRYSDAIQTFNQAITYLPHPKLEELYVLHCGNMALADASNDPTALQAHAVIERRARAQFQLLELQPYQPIASIFNTTTWPIASKYQHTLLETELSVLQRYALKHPTHAVQCAIIDYLLAKVDRNQSPVNYARLLLKQVELTWAMPQPTPATFTDLQAVALEPCLALLNDASAQQNTSTEQLANALPHYLAVAYTWRGVLTTHADPMAENRTDDLSRALNTWETLLAPIPPITTGVPSSSILTNARTQIRDPQALYDHLVFVADFCATHGALILSIRALGVQLRLLHLLPDMGASTKALALYTRLGQACLSVGHAEEASRALHRALAISQQRAESLDPGSQSDDSDNDTLLAHLAHAQLLCALGHVSESTAILSKTHTLAQQILCADHSPVPQSAKLPTRPRKPRPKRLDLVVLARAAYTFAQWHFTMGHLPAAVHEATRSFRLLSLVADTLARRQQAVDSRHSASNGDRKSPLGSDPDGLTNAASTATMAPPYPETLPPSRTAVGALAQNFEQSKLDQKYRVLQTTSHWTLQRLLMDVTLFLSQAYACKGAPKEADYFSKFAVEFARAMRAPWLEHEALACQLSLLGQQQEWANGRDVLAKCTTYPLQWHNDYGPMLPAQLSLEVAQWHHRSKEFDRAFLTLTETARKLFAAEPLLHAAWSIKLTSDQAESAHEHGATGGALGQPIPLLPFRLIQYVNTRVVCRASQALIAQSRFDQALTQLTTIQPTVPFTNHQAEILLTQGKIIWGQAQQTLCLAANTTLEYWNQRCVGSTMFQKVAKAARVPSPTQAAIALWKQLGTCLDHLTQAYDIGFQTLPCHTLTELSLLLVTVQCSRLMLVTEAQGLSEYAGAPMLAYHLERGRGIMARREMVARLRKQLIATPVSDYAWPSTTDPVQTVKADTATGMTALSSDDDAMTSPSLRPRRTPTSARSSTKDTDDPFTLTEASYSIGASHTEAPYYTRTLQDYETFDQLTSDAYQAHYIDILPAAWTVCAISIDPGHHAMYLTRYRSQRPPITVRLPMNRFDIRQNQPAQFEYTTAMDTLDDIIQHNNNSSGSGKFCASREDKMQWWRTRKELDERLRRFLLRIQCRWLGGFATWLNAYLYREEGGQSTSTVTLDQISRFKQGWVKLVAMWAIGRCTTRAKAFDLDDECVKLVLALGVGLKSSDDIADNALDDALRWLLDAYRDHGIPLDYDQIDMAEAAAALCALITETMADSANAVPPQSSHTILVLDKYAQPIPWESLPCLRGQPVSRVPCITFIRDRLQWMRARRFEPGTASHDGTLSLTHTLASLSLNAPPMPKLSLPAPLGSLESSDDLATTSKLRLNKDRLYYVVNPEKDLVHTQHTFEPLLTSQPHWDGVVGRPPLDKECELALTKHDIYLYFGHSGGEQYIKGLKVRALPRCAVSLLFGCSSGLLKSVGEFDPYGTSLNYLIAGSPAVVANLWDVTDKDIDRFSRGLMARWGLINDPQHPNRPGSPKSLDEAVCQSRNDCHLTYLIGAAPIVYGVPCYLG